MEQRFLKEVSSVSNVERNYRIAMQDSKGKNVGMEGKSGCF